MCPLWKGIWFTQPASGTGLGRSLSSVCCGEVQMIVKSVTCMKWERRWAWWMNGRRRGVCHEWAHCHSAGGDAVKERWLEHLLLRGILWSLWTFDSETFKPAVKKNNNIYSGLLLPCCCRVKNTYRLILILQSRGVWQPEIVTVVIVPLLHLVVVLLIISSNNFYYWQIYCNLFQY